MSWLLWWLDVVAVDSVEVALGEVVSVLVAVVVALGVVVAIVVAIVVALVVAVVVVVAALLLAASGALGVVVLPRVRERVCLRSRFDGVSPSPPTSALAVSLPRGPSSPVVPCGPLTAGGVDGRSP